MSFLEQVKKGKVKEPLFILVYGTPGIGKSTLASEAPDVLFLGDQSESSQFDVSRGPEMKSFSECLAALQEMVDAKSLPFKTLAIDNLGWLEKLAWPEIAKEYNKKTYASIGYGKGPEEAMQKHSDFIDLLNKLRKKHGTDIVVIGHSRVKTFQDPTTTSGYDRYQLSIEDKVATVWYRSVDAILFINYEVLKTSDEDKRAVGQGVRVMYTQERPSFQAKNRYGLPYKLVIPIGEAWKTLISAIKVGEPESKATLLEEIEGLLNSVKDEALLLKVRTRLTEAGKDAVKLTAIKDRLLAVIGGIK